MLAGLKGWLLGEPAFDPQSIHVSIVAQLTSTEAYVTTDISLARQLMELKRVADAWRLAVREREIPELNLGTPTGLLPRVEAIEEALDHVCVDWALDVRSAMDAACAVWLDPDTLLGNELSFGTRLQQITIQGASGLVAIAMLDFHARAEINERIWTKAATVVIGSVLREKALAPDEYAAIGLASRGRHEVGAQEAAGAAGRTARRAGAHDQAGPTSAPGHWPHLLSFALPGIEQRARELDGLGVRARAYRRAHAQGEFAFVFETDAHDPAMAPAAAAALLNARSARIEALMRGVVRDLNRALAVDLPLELVLPPTLVGVEVRAASRRSVVRARLLRAPAAGACRARARLQPASAAPPAAAARARRPRSLPACRSPSAARSRRGRAATACAPARCARRCTSSSNSARSRARSARPRRRRARARAAGSRSRRARSSARRRAPSGSSPTPSGCARSSSASTCRASAGSVARVGGTSNCTRAYARAW
jgi:hypothetical protein